jgi:hypothetical protein
LLFLAATARPAAAQVPDAATLLTDIGFSADQIAKIKAGSIIHGDIKASTERELVVAFAFQVKPSPTDLVNQLRKGLMDRTDSNTIAFQLIQGAPTVDAFAKLTFGPNAAKQAGAYLSAAPGTDLNLSSAEIGTFTALGRGAQPAAVEQAVRSALLARLQAYQTKGLAGIAPYARSDGQRSVGDELRSATKATKRLQSLVPHAYQFLLDYPAGRPQGTDETFRWTYFNAHDVPTIALTQGLAMPDGDAWIVSQRQFYVSTGYNCEQAIAAFLPMQGGTLVVYSNRTSTDQVMGWGGGMKRDIGSKLLASQLEDLFGKIQGGAK